MTHRRWLSIPFLVLAPLLLAGDPLDEPPHDWTWIGGGVFELTGAGDRRFSVEDHVVVVPGFEMWRTEVTVDQYRACVADGMCTEPRKRPCDDNWDKTDRGDHPVNYVRWHQAVEFCDWVGGRLPTEAEWEYAARSGGRAIDFPWGDEPASCDLAVMDDGLAGCGEDRTWSVCSRPAGNTEHGLCDMSGNVWEWVQDSYTKFYFVPFPSARADLDEALEEEWYFLPCAHALDHLDLPAGEAWVCLAPAAGGEAWHDSGNRERVIRGGSYLTDLAAGEVRRPLSAVDVGFRCVR